MSLALLCLPFAGAGAGFFRPWKDHPFQHVEVVPVQLPGREEWFVKDPCTTLDDAVAVCVEQALPVAGERPFALFGHSFGALLAYEVAHRLAADGFRAERLVVSGSAGPWLPRPRLGLAALSDEEFVGRLSEFVGYEHEALQLPELRELLLPALRADLEITDGYRPSSTSPLDVPVTVVRGAGDTFVSRDDAAAWADVTTAGCEVVELPGEHMYLAEWRPLAEVLDRVSAQV